MMSGHNNLQNKKKKGGGSKGAASKGGGGGRHKPDDEMSAPQDGTNMLKAVLKLPSGVSGVSVTSSSHSSPTKDSPSNFLPQVDELFPAASARVEERVDYWQEEEVQKFMQSNPNHVESASPVNRAHNYLAGTFNFSSDHERSSWFSSPDRCSGSRSVLTTVTEFFRGSIAAASSGSRNGGGIYYDTTTSPSETETCTWTTLLPLKRLILHVITVVLYLCDALGIKAALTEKVSFDLYQYAFVSDPYSFFSSCLLSF